MLLADFHTHSTFDDGKSTLAEMAAAARALGLIRLGFSGHSYCPGQEDFCTPRDQVQAYLTAARALQRKYAGQMEIFVGMELDLYGERPEGLDYRIGSVHSLSQNGVLCSVDESPEASRRTVEEQFGGDWYRYTDAYFDLVAQLPEKTDCDWIGHFDLVSKFNQQDPCFDEESPRYLRRALEVLEYLAGRGVCLEINTGAVTRGYRAEPYPSRPLLRRWRELGGELVLNSDAHHVSHLCGRFQETEEMLKEIGFTHVNVWTQQGFQAVGLLE